MPTRAPRPCSHPLCSKLTNNQSNSYCDEHQPESGWDRHNAKIKESDGYKSVRITNSRKWSKIRERVMKRDGYLCQMCLAEGRDKEGSEVDHIVPVIEGGTDDLDNLQYLCISCHKSKTHEERQRGIARRKAAAQEIIDRVRERDK